MYLYYGNLLCATKKIIKAFCLLAYGHSLTIGKLTELCWLGFLLIFIIRPNMSWFYLVLTKSPALLMPSNFTFAE